MNAEKIKIIKIMKESKENERRKVNDFEKKDRTAFKRKV